jgi:hypothetical protein
MHNSDRAADHQQHNFLEKYTLLLETQQDSKSENDTEDASTTKNVWEIRERLTKRQT